MRMRYTRCSRLKEPFFLTIEERDKEGDWHQLETIKRLGKPRLVGKGCRRRQMFFCREFREDFIERCIGEARQSNTQRRPRRLVWWESGYDGTPYMYVAWEGR